MGSTFIRTALHPENVRVPLTAADKPGVIRELLDILDASGDLPDRAAAEAVVFDRENLMSTGLEHGLAIPHGKTDTVPGLVVAAGTHPEGIDFACADGKVARIFILTVSPASRSGPHIRLMAEISTLVRDDTLRGRLLDATTAEEVYALLAGIED